MYSEFIQCLTLSSQANLTFISPSHANTHTHTRYLSLTHTHMTAYIHTSTHPTKVIHLFIFQKSYRDVEAAILRR
jgi:general stress protein 26